MSTPTWDETTEVSSKKETEPTWEDTAEVSPVGKLESLARGTAAGLSLDFVDELTGAGEALAQAAVGPDKFSDLLDNYRKYRDESREAYKEAKETNPASYFAGDILGSVLPSLATGGVTAAANLGKVGVKQGMKELAKAGAKQGAAVGLGSSEADLTQGEVGQVALDTGISSIVGAGVGATLPTAVKGVTSLAKNTANAAIDTAPKFIKRGIDAFSVAEQGIPVVGEKANQRLQSDALKTAEDLLNQFRSQYSRGSSKVGGALNSPNNNQVDFANQLQKLETTLNSSSMLPDDLAKIQKELDLYKDIITTETVEPGLEKATQRMQSLIDKAKSEAEALGQSTKFTDPENVSNKFLQSLQTTSNEAEEIIPKVRQVDIPEDKVITETVEKFRNMDLSELNNVKAQLKDILSNSNIDSKSKGIVSDLVKEVDNAITSNMDDVSKEFYRAGNQEIRDVYRAGDLFKELSPDNRFAENLDIPLAQKLLKAEGLKDETLNRVLGYANELPENIAKEASQLSTRADISKALSGEGSILGGLINPSSMAVRTGSALGNVTRKAENVVKPVSDFTKNIIKMEDQALSSMAMKLKQSNDPISKNFGDKLDKILQTDKRDKLLWSLSQQPAFRKMANQAMGINETTEEQN